VANKRKLIVEKHKGKRKGSPNAHIVPRNHKTGVKTFILWGCTMNASVAGRRWI
jgi:hypothetical protein